MIEATCSACGTLNRIAEADVPAGAKFVNCSSCKSRVVLPAKAAIPSIPKPPLPRMPPPMPKPPARPPGAAPGGDEVGLSDLPAPRRQSALGNEPSRPAPRSALSSALDDLPAPKAAGGPPPSLDLDDLMGAELPAPKSSGVSDLPAPKPRAPTPRPVAAQPPGVSDLPAPKVRPGGGRPAPSSMGSPVDLPAPKPGGYSNLPAPKPGGYSDLPAPKGGGYTDLPAPKAGGFGDLPAPKGGRQPAGRNLDLDLPAPKGGGDLPAPKGFFDDLPQPAGPGRGADRPEVPAPKGFFDDLPQPARNRPPGEDIAPKGFFDDLPGRPAARAPGLDNPEVPAPKGFFDDLPQPARSKQPSIDPIGGIPLDLGDDSPIELAEQASDVESRARQRRAAVRSISSICRGPASASTRRLRVPRWTTTARRSSGSG